MLKTDLKFLSRVVAGAKFAATGFADSAWFGPGQPQQPVAPDSEKGRQFDYPFAVNVTQNRKETDAGVSYAQLRQLADNYDLMRIVIESRKDQIAKLSWSIKHKSKKIEEDQKAKNLEAFFKSPDKESSWDEWLRMVIEDVLVIDAPAIYLRMTKGGQMYALEPVAGETIVRLLDSTGRTPQEGPAYQQVIKGLVATDYTKEEMIYRPRNKRTHKVYGFSPVEQIVTTVNIALRRQAHTIEYYSAGSVPDALAGVPAEWGTEQIKEFQEYWDLLMSGDTARRRKLKFVPGDLAKNFRETKQPPLKDVFDEWLARVVCYAFSVDCNAFISQVNRATAETTRKQALSEGLIPLMTWVKNLIDFVLANHLDAADYEFLWVDEKSVDPLIQAQINTMYVNAGILSANQVRADLGIDADPDDEQSVSDNEPLGKTATPTTIRKNSSSDKKTLTKAQARLKKTLASFFSSAALDVYQQLAKSTSLAKAAGNTPADKLNFDSWADTLPAAVAPLLTKAAEIGANETLAKLGTAVAGDEELLSQIGKVDSYELAVAWAKERSAEMVGMKWVDGELVPNPSAKWQIIDSTRAMINGLIETAVEEGWSTDTLRDEILAAHAFSESRAETIARTEIALAQMGGHVGAAQEAGVTKKRWSTSQDDHVSDDCVQCEDDGEIGIDELFSTGVSAPPHHPNCRCAITFSFGDKWTT